MTPRHHTHKIAGVGVPVSLLSDPEAFGGTVEGDLRAGTLLVRDGRAVGLENPGAHQPVSRIVMPRLTEAHVHLDKCHTVHRMDAVGGDLAAALAAQREDKANWTGDDLQARIRRGLDELARAGCGAVRSHIDWAAGTDTSDAPLAWEVICALKDSAQDQGILLQPAALTGIDEMARGDQAMAVARRVSRDGGVLGSFLLAHENRQAGLRALFRAADRFGLALDFHVDEGLDASLNGLEMVADLALEMRFEGPLLCGHACSLASKAPGDVTRIADKLQRAGIAVAALPSTNLYLQGRRSGTPDRRGLTLLHELAKQGVETLVGTDNVRDAFCPVGRHDPVSTLSLAVLAGHLDPPFGRHLPMITTTARKAMGLAPLRIDGAACADLIATPATDLSELLSGTAAPVCLTNLIREARHD
ncbi:amidohydrolase family protein [uncultured Roseobacter sp.]|uniref:amidohydrolase family protein n=1 Tax=uncultured Roseobacter sp. TaxID=114847 RepID=UPI002633FAF9|nr:amidohydrolase family protein [uncultured Roseobacter sp.]